MKTDLRPYLARAIAMQPAAHATLDKLFEARSGECIAAANRSDCRNHPRITGGRAEDAMRAARVLGVLDVYADRDDPRPLRSLLRAANKRLYDAISAAEHEVSESLIMDAAGADDIDDDDLADAAVLALGIITILDKTPADSTLAKLVTDFARNDGKNISHIPDGRMLREAKLFYGADSFTGLSGLYGSAADAGYSRFLDPIMLSADHAGIITDAYVQGITIDAEDLAHAWDLGAGSRQRWQNALVMLLARAAAADREFCADQLRRESGAELARARAELSAARAESVQLSGELSAARIALQQAGDALRERERSLAQAREKLAGLERRLKKAGDALAASDPDADRREIAALRAALYASSPDSPPAPAPEAPRELPENVVSIGGWPAWLDSMRAAVPGVRFYPPDVLIPDAVLRAADEIWIMPDYLGHKDFYRVAAAARRAHVPLRYFASSGVERCRAQLYAKE